VECDLADGMGFSLRKREAGYDLTTG